MSCGIHSKPLTVTGLTTGHWSGDVCYVMDFVGEECQQFQWDCSTTTSSFTVDAGVITAPWLVAVDATFRRRGLTTAAPETDDIAVSSSMLTLSSWSVSSGSLTPDMKFSTSTYSHPIERCSYMQQHYSTLCPISVLNRGRLSYTTCKLVTVNSS